MSAPPFKFGVLDDNSREVPYHYGDQWAIEETSGPPRLTIAPSSEHIRLVSELVERMEEPFYLLYVLVVPRSEDSPGRYQSPVPLSKDDVLGFLTAFQTCLEADGRHHLWLKSVGEPDLLVYDRHNVIYAYGNLDSYKPTLLARGLVQAPKITFPSPHVHSYRAECDQDCQKILEYLEWTYSPLHDSDD